MKTLTIHFQKLPYNPPTKSTQVAAKHDGPIPSGEVWLGELEGLTWGVRMEELGIRAGILPSSSPPAQVPVPMST